jgi:TPR repeat protein
MTGPRILIFVAACFVSLAAPAQEAPVPANEVAGIRAKAEQGDAPAQRTLGFMYEYGRGVAKDYVEAVKWYRKAAEQGYAAGQTCLGVMYENGRGVPKNDAEAVKWYRKAAEQGYAAGQTNGLARIYGVRTPLFDGRTSAQYRERLAELEAQAKREKRGAWRFVK